MFSVMPDLHGPSGGSRGVEAHDDVVADKGCVDFVKSAVEADGAVFLDLAFGLEEEEIVEVESGVGEANLVGGLRPALERGFAIEPAMRGLVVLALCVLGTYVAASPE